LSIDGQITGDWNYLLEHVLINKLK
jgi:hypothetical protein